MRVYSFPKISKVISLFLIASISSLAGNARATSIFHSAFPKPPSAPRDQMITPVSTDGIDLSNDPFREVTGFLVGIRTANPGDKTSVCLGAVVLPDVVLTAGHCLMGSLGNPNVRFIRKLHPLEYAEAPVKAYKVHPAANGGYDGEMYDKLTISEANKYHDIAVILLKKPSKLAAPISIVSPKFNPVYAPKDFTFYSYGHRRNSETLKLEEALDYLTFSDVLPYGSSNSWFIAKAILPKKALSCQGDSGSPVTIGVEDEKVPGQKSYALVGIQTTASSGVGEYEAEQVRKSLAASGESNIPTCTSKIGFIDITHHLDWINETLRELDPKHPRSLHIYGE